MELIDTHCHIHFEDYQLDSNYVIKNAIKHNVKKMICVGCTLSDSQLGVKMANKYKNIWASVGVHPHEADKYIGDEKAKKELSNLASQSRVVAIGEVGLDYYYNHSSKKSQQKMLEFQLGLAANKGLPMIFHIRNPKSYQGNEMGPAFADFFKIMSNYKNITGVVHSFTANKAALETCLAAGLYIGLNGIITFTKNIDQLEVAKMIPNDKLLLETDAPFLTPNPHRGKICEPKHVVVTAEFISCLRRQTLASIALVTTNNAKQLFKLV